MGVLKIADKIKKAALPYILTGLVIALCSCAKKDVFALDNNSTGYLMEVRVLVGDSTDSLSEVTTLSFTEQYRFSSNSLFCEALTGGLKPIADFKEREPYIEFLKVLDVTDKDVKVLIDGDETFLNLNEKYSFSSKYVTHPDSKIYRYELIFFQKAD